MFVPILPLAEALREYIHIEKNIILIFPIQPYVHLIPFKIDSRIYWNTTTN